MTSAATHGTGVADRLAPVMWAETVQIGACSMTGPQGPAVYTFDTTYLVRAGQMA